MNHVPTEPAWVSHLAIATRAFRVGMEASGSESLTRFIDAAALVLKKMPPDTVQQLGAVLSESLSAQARHDYSFLADMLEYRIRPLLLASDENVTDRPERITE